MAEAASDRYWWEGTRLAALFKRLFNMTGCSERSRRLLSAMREQLNASFPPTAPADVRCKLLDCPSCEGFMLQPLCLPCGHSMCKSCVYRPPWGGGVDGDVLCSTCRQRWPWTSPGCSGERCPTLVLLNVMEKWYPKWVESCRHREEGNKFAVEGDFPVALTWYNKAMETGVQDHRVLGNRSRAYVAMDLLDKALEEADTCCRLRPQWAKGHFRYACVLEKLGRWKEAVGAYLLCLHLGANDTVIAKLLCQLLDQHVLRSCEPAGGGGSDGEEEGGQGEMAVVGVIVQGCVERVTELQSAAGTQTYSQPTGLDESDFECALCTGLLYNPVTSPCGHSFCSNCLSRSFDHSPLCPMCRSPLPEHFLQHCRTSGRMTVDQTLEGLLLVHFREKYEAKMAQVQADLLRRSRVGLVESEDLPVFVCTLAYPGLPCPLHIFEPRYRLMIRECMETESRRFGMCPAWDDSSAFADYGTVLHINSVDYTPDGRSLVSTTGERRFKVVERGMINGHHTTKIQFLMDEPVTGDLAITAMRALQREVYDHAKAWLNALPFTTRLLIVQTVCSPLPEMEPCPECCPNGPMWVWWYIRALPSSTHRKLELLQTTSLSTRLNTLRALLPLPNPHPPTT